MDDKPHQWNSMVAWLYVELYISNGSCLLVYLAASVKFVSFLPHIFACLYKLQHRKCLH